MMEQYQEFIAASRYARWLPEEGRRETWDETVMRYVTFWQDKGHIDADEAIMLDKAICDLEVMPSMRCLMNPGGAPGGVPGLRAERVPMVAPEPGTASRIGNSTW